MCEDNALSIVGHDMLMTHGFVIHREQLVVSILCPGFCIMFWIFDSTKTTTVNTVQISSYNNVVIETTEVILTVCNTIWPFESLY